MGDVTPGGAPISFAGTPIQGGYNVASVGFPTVTKEPTEAYALTLGLHNPVDLYNGIDPVPTKQTLTCQVLIRADDSIADPRAAYAALMAGYHALEGMPQVGTLLVNGDAGGGAVVQAKARRRPINLVLAPKNSRHLVVELSFTLLEDWH